MLKGMARKGRIAELCDVQHRVPILIV